MTYAQDRDGNDNAQLYLISLEEKKIIPLTAGFKGAMHIFGEWSSDGSQILFEANHLAKISALAVGI